MLPSKTLLLILVLFAYAGCTDRLAIKSIPDGALVTVDGSTLGYTPTELAVGRYQRWPKEISIEKPGYKPYIAGIKTQPEVGRFLVGFVFWGPFSIFFQPLSSFDYSNSCYQNWAECNLYVTLEPAPIADAAPPPL